MRRLALVFALLALGGCAASGPKYDEIQSAIPSVSPGSGRVYFFRDGRMMGAAIRPEIQLNDQTVGRSVPGSFFYVDRPAGKYLVKVTTEVERTLEVALQPGQTVYVRSYMTFGVLAGRVQLELATPAVWEELRGGLSYIGDPAAPRAGK